MIVLFVKKKKKKNVIKDKIYFLWTNSDGISGVEPIITSNQINDNSDHNWLK